MSKKSSLTVLQGAQAGSVSGDSGAKKARKATRGQTLARAQDVAKTFVGDKTPLDAAFAAFSRFDGEDGAKDAQAIAQAQALVRALLQPEARRAAAALVESKKP